MVKKIKTRKSLKSAAATTTATTTKLTTTTMKAKRQQPQQQIKKTVLDNNKKEKKKKIFNDDAPPVCSNGQASKTKQTHKAEVFEAETIVLPATRRSDENVIPENQVLIYKNQKFIFCNNMLFCFLLEYF